MQVPWTHCRVMAANVMLALIISQIFLSRVPSDEIGASVHLVRYPKISHFHLAGPLSLDGVVGYADCSFVVAVYWCGSLWVVESFEDETEDTSFLAIEK